MGLIVTNFISTSPLGRKYNYYRHEQNLWNAIAKTDYSHFRYWWIGGDLTRNHISYYVPAYIMSLKLFIDFLGSKDKETKLTKRRKGIIHGMNAHVIYVKRKDSVSEMYMTIQFKIRELERIKYEQL